MAFSLETTPFDSQATRYGSTEPIGINGVLKLSTRSEQIKLFHVMQSEKNSISRLFRITGFLNDYPTALTRGEKMDALWNLGCDSLMLRDKEWKSRDYTSALAFNNLAFKLFSKSLDVHQFCLELDTQENIESDARFRSKVQSNLKNLIQDEALIKKYLK
ncbi:hypothetical protein D5018_19950 [Parashewanella curva]|uniref:Uncharacterized protein n=1 Tax=Parashewanella curva TaxID=2338552 RepID=A0A3L8PSY4_9GAMM|nr:hypothetical protein [Parashewanella curva]RLV57929.1 hypothetical protein D5018_19950 [Parashewanella curva]